MVIGHLRVYELMENKYEIVGHIGWISVDEKRAARCLHLMYDV